MRLPITTAGRPLGATAAAGCACLLTIFFCAAIFLRQGWNPAATEVRAPCLGRGEQQQEYSLFAGARLADGGPREDVVPGAEFAEGPPDGRRPVLVAIASRKRHVARRRQIRRLLFGVNDNLRPCLAQAGPVRYKFLVFGEPQRSLPAQAKLSFDEERHYRVDLMEHDDIVQLETVWLEGDRNSTGANILERQAAVAEWVARAGEPAHPRSYDHAIVTDDLTFLRLDRILENLHAKNISYPEFAVPLSGEQSAYLLWGFAAGAEMFGVGAARTFVVGYQTIRMLASWARLLRAMAVAADEGPPEDLWDSFILSRPESGERTKLNVVHDRRFAAWRNRLDPFFERSLAVAGVYQDEELLSLVGRSGGPRPVPVCRRPLGRPGGPAAVQTSAPTAAAPAKLSIAVVTSSYIHGDPCMVEAGVAAAENKRSYAARHGYAFVARSAEFAQQAARSPPRKFVWGKIDVVEKLLPHYDWLLWMDMDAVVVDMSRSVESVLEALRDRPAPAPAPADGGPEAKSLVIAQPTRNPMVNAGVFLIRNSRWSAEFLREVQARRTQYWGKMYEQKAIWDVMLEPRWAPGVLHLRDDDHSFNTFPERFLPGDFIVHYAPQKCPAAEVIKTATSGQVVAGDGRVFDGWPARQKADASSAR